MSEVTNVVILASVCDSDGPEIAAVNAELKRLGVTSGEFVEVSKSDPAANLSKAHPIRQARFQRFMCTSSSPFCHTQAA